MTSKPKSPTSRLGRPAGRLFPHKTTIKLDDETKAALGRVAAKWDMDASKVIRRLIVMAAGHC